MTTPKPVSGLSEFDKLESAWDFTRKMKIGVYGSAATGKTTFWSSFPKPLLAIICGSKGELMSLDQHYFGKDVTAKIASSSKHLQVLFDHAWDRQCAGKPYATIALDHCSGLQHIYMREILKVDKLPEQWSWGMADQDEYGHCTLLCKEYIARMLDLDAHEVMVAQEREFEKAKAIPGVAFIGPGLMPSLAGWFNSTVNCVVQTFIRDGIRKEQKGKGPGGKPIFIEVPTGKIEYCIRTEASTVFQTKFRIPRRPGFELPPVIVDPTYGKIVELIESQRK